MLVQIDLNNIIIDVNSYTCEVFGYSRAEMIGLNWFNNFIPRTETAFKRENVEENVKYYDRSILLKDGSTRNIFWNKTNIYNENNEITSVICLGEELTKIDNYLVTLHLISSLLLKDSNDVPYAEFVKIVGEAANADHTYIFLTNKAADGKVHAKKVSEWGKGRHINNLENLPGLNSLNVNSFSDDLTGLLEKGGCINLKVSSFPEWEQGFFKQIGIQAILIIPISVDNEFIGFIGFDNRETEREWTNSELEFLKASTRNLEQCISRYKASEAIILENQKFQTTMDAIESIVMVSNFKNSKITYLNKFGYKMLGDVIGLPVSKALNLNIPLPENFCENDLLLNSKGEPNEAKEWVIESAQTNAFFNSKVKAIKWTKNEWARLDTIVDVSEKMRAKVTLLESEAKFRKLSAITIEGIIIHDKGVVLDANIALCNLLQYEHDEIIGLNIIELAVLPEYHETVLANLQKKNPEPYEVYARKKDGTIIPTEVEAKSIHYQDEILRVVAIRDITERKKAEAELIRQKDKAEESNRLKTQFLNNMSHEIRTPLNGIVGFTQFLDDPDLPAEKKSHFVNIIQSSSTQLVRIIDDIIEISKLETKQVKPRKEKVSINSMLLELFSIFELNAKEKNISLHLKKGLSDYDSVIFTDKTKLLKILNNLVENALKFTAKGFVEIGYELIENDLKIWIKDSGIGIPLPKQKLIFERFSQADSETSAVYGGLGLGLAIATENTNLLGGKITIDSIENEGATFNVMIPYVPVNEPKEETVNDAKGQYKYHVLIAEDEEVNFIFLEFLLQNMNKEIKIANVRNGEEAIQYCAENSDLDLVFMDVKMPIVNGFEATLEIRKTNKNIPIVAITAFSGYADRERANQVGCNDFMTKPIDANLFRKICEKNLFQNSN